MYSMLHFLNKNKRFVWPYGILGDVVLIIAIIAVLVTVISASLLKKKK